jgi:hypothetical protein
MLRRIVAIACMAQTAAAEPPAHRFDVVATLGATLSADDGAWFGPGGAIALMAGRSTWGFGLRVGTWSYRADHAAANAVSSPYTAHENLYQVHLLSYVRAEQVTLAFGLGVDGRDSNDGTYQTSDRYLLGSSVAVSYDVLGTGSHHCELAAVLSASPLIDLVPVLSGGEGSAPHPVFSVLLGASYRFEETF